MPLVGRPEQDALCPEIAGKGYVCGAVADDVARCKVVVTVHVAGEHPCPRFACRGVLMLEGPVDQLVGEFDPFAAERF